MSLPSAEEVLMILSPPSAEVVMNDGVHGLEDLAEGHHAALHNDDRGAFTVSCWKASLATFASNNTPLPAKTTCHSVCRKVEIMKRFISNSDNSFVKRK